MKTLSTCLIIEVAAEQMRWERWCAFLRNCHVKKLCAGEVELLLLHLPAFPPPALTSSWSKGRRGEEGRKIHAFLSHYNTTQTKSSMHYLAGGPGRKKYRNLKIPPLNSYAEPSSFYMSAYGGDKKIPLTPSTAP